MRIRRLKIKPDTINDETKLSEIDSAAATFFGNFNRDETLKQFFIEGYTYEEIANWAEKQGLLTISKDTFIRYLVSYRKIRREFFDDLTNMSTFGVLAGADVPIDEHKNFVLMKLQQRTPLIWRLQTLCTFRLALFTCARVCPCSRHPRMLVANHMRKKLRHI